MKRVTYDGARRHTFFPDIKELTDNQMAQTILPKGAKISLVSDSKGQIIITFENPGKESSLPKWQLHRIQKKKPVVSLEQEMVESPDRVHPPILLRRGRKTSAPGKGPKSSRGAIYGVPISEVTDSDVENQDSMYIRLVNPETGKIVPLDEKMQEDFYNYIERKLEIKELERLSKGTYELLTWEASQGKVGDAYEEASSLNGKKWKGSKLETGLILYS